MGERLGILGGAFDPPHVGHAIVAVDVFENLRLDRLLLVPAGQPPHRATVLPAGLRYELVARLVRDAEGLEVSDMELRREGPSYTVDTLALLREEMDRRDLFCVMGADQLQVIDTWHDYRRLPELAQVAVMRRAGLGPAADAPAKIAYIVVDVTRIDVSSTQIRERLRAGRSIRYLVPESIRERVEEAWRVYDASASA